MQEFAQWLAYNEEHPLDEGTRADARAACIQESLFRSQGAKNVKAEWFMPPHGPKRLPTAQMMEQKFAMWAAQHNAAQARKKR